MSRPAPIPNRGDVGFVAQPLGLPLADFEARRAELERQGFPDPDPTTGRYCIEAELPGESPSSELFQGTMTSALGAS